MDHYRGKILEKRYCLTHKIGQGGMATVYLAEHIHLRSQVAIKQNIFSSSPDERLLFEQEARLLARLGTHPNRPPSLPAVSDYFFSDPSEGQQIQYLVLNYIEGEDLHSILQRTSALNEKVALFWIGQIMEALEFLHSQPTPIIHRDLKPSNIRISPDGQRAYLVDFGLAGAASQKIGTDGFAPPEQYQGQTDTRSDIYALGATLYTLLSGQIPPASTDLVDKHTTLPPFDPKLSLSASIKTAILQAMALEPAQRYQTIAEMRQALHPQPLTRPSNLGTWQPHPQQPAPLDPPPLITPRQVCTWWAESQTNTFHIVVTANNRLISGGSSGLLNFWSLTNWHTPGQLVGWGRHEDWISCLALSRDKDSRWVASGSWDRTIHVWNTHTGQPVRAPLVGHKDAITALAFSPDGQWLASAGASKDLTIRLWPLAGADMSSILLADNIPAQGLAFSPTGQWLAVAGRNQQVRLWQVSSKAEITLPAEIGGHAGPTWAIAFSPDGRLLAFGGEDRLLHLAETQDPSTGASLEPERWRRRYVIGQQPGTIYCLAFSSDGRLLVSGGADKHIHLWDIRNDQYICCYGPFSDEILSVAFESYGRYVAVANKNGVVAQVQLG